MAVDPVDHSVYVGTVPSADGIWKSTDFGETFTRIDRAPGAAPDEFLDLNGRGITVDPNNHDRLPRGPRHRPLAITGCRRELDQSRHETRRTT